MNSFSLIIFGITSNLAQIKLIPALYDMEEKGLLPKDMVIVGSARSSKTRSEFISYIRSVLNMENRHHQHPIKAFVADKLISKMYYLDGNLDDQNFYLRLKEFLDQLKKDGNSDNRIYYLATYPNLYHFVFEGLQKLDMSSQKNGFVRLMIEKPIGSDLRSARSLNKLIKRHFSEDQVYRLDHYLGKETLQNILTFRFGNKIFEPLINSSYIDHIQVTASEDFGVGDRGSYYDGVGALKDVGQNHQLQMLAFVTMEAPDRFTNEEITFKRLKIIQNLVRYPDDVVFGQYLGYQNEKNVDPKSKTETFYALKTEINIPRYRGVPIYIRAGKKLAQTVTEISIVFKNPANRLFSHLRLGNDPNILIYRLQPNEGIVLKILTKKPGYNLDLEPEYMQYCYRKTQGQHFFPDPYERLFFDALVGDQTFFNDAAEVEAQWKFIDPLILQKKELYKYKPGSWGPLESDRLIERDGRVWLEPSMQFCRI